MVWTDKGMTSDLGRGMRGIKSVWMQPASTIQPVGIGWLWPGYLACEKFHLLAGPAGTGKTTLAAAVAATITRGGRWPNNTLAPIGNIVFWTGEDGVEDTLVPRLLASGADMSCVHILRGTYEATGKARPFSFETDIPQLSAALGRIGKVSLIIIDPIVQAVSGDANKNADVRRGLAPLLELAETHGSAILGITHVNKGSAKKEPIDRVNGSLAFAAVARIVLMTAKCTSGPDDGEGAISRAVLVRAKSNISADDGGYEYAIRPVSVGNYLDQITTTALAWGEHIKGSAKEILAFAAEPADFSRALGEAVVFLQDLLAIGPMTVPEIEAQAKVAGISSSALKRAKKELRIKSVKATGQGQFSPHVWRLPTAGDGDEAGWGGSVPANFSTFMQSRAPMPGHGLFQPITPSMPFAGTAPVPHREEFAPFGVPEETDGGIGGGQLCSVEPLEPLEPLEPVEPVEPVEPQHAAPTITLAKHVLDMLIGECKALWASGAYSDEGDEDRIARIAQNAIGSLLAEFPEEEVASYGRALHQAPWWA